MARSAEALINPEMLVWARESLRLDVDESARRIGVSEERYRQWEAAEARPTTSQLKKVASVFKRPFAAFYLSEVPEHTRRPPQDFRHAAGHVPGEMSSELALDFDLALDRREIVLELTSMHNGKLPAFALTAIQNEAPELVGARLRAALLGRESLPREPRLAFNRYREAAEALGVLVFQSNSLPVGQMRGFSVSETVAPVVVVNRKEAYAGRSFTLLHELTHLMLRASGVCDFEDIEGLPPEHRRIEVFCNAVAAAALLPLPALKAHDLVVTHEGASWSDEDLKAIARSFGASPEAVLRRLLFAGLTTQAFYEKKRKEYEGEYARMSSRPKEEQGFVPPSTDVVSLAGKPYARMVLGAVDAGTITANRAADYLGVRIKHFDQIREKSA